MFITIWLCPNVRGDIFKGTVSEQNKIFELNIKLNNRKSYMSFAHLKLYTESFSFSIHSIIDQDTGVSWLTARKSCSSREWEQSILDAPLVKHLLHLLCFAILSRVFQSKCPMVSFQWQKYKWIWFVSILIHTGLRGFSFLIRFNDCNIFYHQDSG